MTLQEAVDDFLAQKRIAVLGVSRTPTEAANLIYRKLREAGYTVYAVNPLATEAEGDPCYADLRALPEVPDGVVIATPPATALGIVEVCAALGVPRVWMHRSFGTGSVSEEAVRRAEALGLTVIPGACPMMFVAPVDGGHRCIRWFLKVSGKLPTPTEGAAAWA